MTRQNLDQLKQIFEGIWSGELDHDQSDYSCGTSKCVAGWAIEMFSDDEKLKQKLACDSSSCTVFQAIDLWFTNYFQLTSDEVSCIVNENATKSLHARVLDGLLDGRSFLLENSLSIDSEDYDGTCYLSFGSLDDATEFCQFIGLDENFYCDEIEKTDDVYVVGLDGLGS